MMMVASKVLGEAFWMVLAVLAAPQNVDEFRIDAIGRQGYMGTMIVCRVDQGFEVYDEMNGQRKKYMTIQASGEQPGAYVVHNLAKETEEIVNPSAICPKLDLAKLRTAELLVLAVQEGGRIQVNRSGDILYLSSEQARFTQAVHLGPDPKKD